MRRVLKTASLLRSVRKDDGDYVEAPSLSYGLHLHQALPPHIAHAVPLLDEGVFGVDPLLRITGADHHCRLLRTAIAPGVDALQAQLN